MISENSHYDVIVVGGGPAGATAGALLAQQGYRVLILEKSRFPRYHVGESLMPFCYFTLERLGVVDQLNDDSLTVPKHSVQFVTPDGRISAPFYFYQHMKHRSAQTWQVKRDRFDQLLLQRAAALGATVREQTHVKRLMDMNDRVSGVIASTGDEPGREYTAEMVIDASGRDGLAMNQFGWKKPDPTLKKIAIWTNFKGGKRDEGMNSGATTVAYVPERGWFWYIPMPDDIISVGIVAERDYLYRGPRDPLAILNREIENNQWIKDHLAEAKQEGEVWVTGDYSYRSAHCAKDGLLLVGDAFAFLDPVFSSGVFLALRSGELAADAIDRALKADDVSASRFTGYAQTMRSGIEAMRKLVYAFYDEGFSFGQMIKKYPQLRPDLTDCLIGDLFRDLTPLYEAVAEFAEAPEPLQYGDPQVAKPTSNTPAQALA